MMRIVVIDTYPVREIGVYSSYVSVDTVSEVTSDVGKQVRPHEIGQLLRHCVVSEGVT